MSGVTPIDFVGPAPHYDLVLSGAGISGGWPSSVPSGDRLMQNTWARLLRKPGDHAQAVGSDGLSRDQLEMLAPVSDSLNSEHPPIVLEALAQILLEHIGDHDLVVSTYVDVSTDQFNSNHAKLASLDGLQVTLNMDRLFEAAGVIPWHLHGEWDKPESIVTFASQYRDGLPQEERNRLLSLLDNATVLVVGYSGRDIDVMPILKRSGVKRLDWMHYGGRVEPSVVGLHEALGARMTIFAGGVDQIIAGSPEVPSDDNSRAPGQDRYDEVGHFARVLAAAAVAAEVGHDSSATMLLRSERMWGDHEISRRKALARIESRRGNDSNALKILTAPSFRPSTVRRFPFLLSEIAQALQHSGHSWRARSLNRLLVHQPRAELAARIRLARQDQVAGRLIDSRDALFTICHRPDVHKKIGVAGLVDAMTSLSDSQKMVGEYVAAKKSAAEAAEMGAYANPSQRDSALRRLVELSHLQGERQVLVPGETPMSTSELAEVIYSAASERRDMPLMFWAAATAADVANHRSGAASIEWLTLAREVMPPRSAVAQLYVGLIDVEREKSWGSITRAHDLASALTAATQVRRRRKPTASRTIARLAVIECAMARGNEDLVSDSLDAIITDARALGARTVAARAELVKHSVSGARLPETTAAEWRSQGWLWEATLAEGPLAEVACQPWPVIL